MTTAAELAELVAGALEGASATVVARWEGPADLTATPAVVVSPAAPWIRVPRLGGCAHVAWSVELLCGRWDAPTALALAQAGYLAAVPLVAQLGDFVALGALGAPVQETVAGIPVLATSFDVTLST